MKKYMVFDVGCIECGESSEIVGFYDLLATAKTAKTKAEVKQEKDWHGQHEFLIFETDKKEPIYDL